MAAPIIKIKRSSVPEKIPTPDQLPTGEIGLNTFDGKLFASKNVGIGTTVFVVNSWSVGPGTNTYNTYFTEGNVGIGTTLPTSKLSVIGDGSFTGVMTAVTFSGNATSATYASNAGIATSVINNPGVGISTAGGIVGTGATILNFQGSGISTVTVSSGIATININSGGESSSSQTLNQTLGFGNTSSLGMVVGVITATDFNSTSDISLKNNICNIENPIEKIIQINGVEFVWKENRKQSGGVIAQEVEKVLPNLVNGNEIKTVNYNGLIGLLIEGIKDQQKQIDALKNLISE